MEVHGCLQMQDAYVILTFMPTKYAGSLIWRDMRPPQLQQHYALINCMVWQFSCI